MCGHNPFRNLPQDLLDDSLYLHVSPQFKASPGMPFFSVDKHARDCPCLGKMPISTAPTSPPTAHPAWTSSSFTTVGPDYTKYMDIQQAINLQIFESFSKAKIEFAYPTQTLFLNQAN